MGKLYKFVDSYYPLFLMLYMVYIPLFLIISGFCYRLNSVIQENLSIVTLLLTIIVIGMKLLYNFDKKSIKAGIKSSILTFLIGGLPSTLIIINLDFWIWIENLSIAFILSYFIESFYRYLSVSPAEVRIQGSLEKIRDATHKESIFYFGRDPVMIFFGYLMCGVLLYSSVKYSLNGELLIEKILSVIGR